MELTLELTNKCYNHCLHCSSLANITNNTYLDFELIKFYLEKYKPESVNISGGEPLLHENIIEIIKYINNKNIKIKLYTSGFDLNFEDKIKNIYKLIDTIVFPYYSYNENVFNKIMGNNKGYTYVKNAMKLACELKINIEVHLVPMTLNIYDLEKTIDLLLNENKYINKINILKLVNQGRVNYNNFLIPEDELLKKILLKIKDKYSEKIKLGLPLNEKFCVAGIEKMVILCNGIEIPCESYKDGICKCNRLNII